MDWLVGYSQSKCFRANIFECVVGCFLWNESWLMVYGWDLFFGSMPGLLFRFFSFSLRKIRTSHRARRAHAQGPHKLLGTPGFLMDCFKIVVWYCENKVQDNVRVFGKSWSKTSIMKYHSRGISKLSSLNLLPWKMMYDWRCIWWSEIGLQS